MSNTPPTTEPAGDLLEAKDREILRLICDSAYWAGRLTGMGEGHPLAGFSLETFADTDAADELAKFFAMRDRDAAALANYEAKHGEGK